MNQSLGYLLGNAAMTLDGVELDFRGDKCGRSYRISRHTPGTIPYWECYFNDWHELGWRQINRWPGEETRRQAIEVCNQHAVEKRLLNFLPTKPRYRPTQCIPGMAAALAATTGSGLGGLFGL